MKAAALSTETLVILVLSIIVLVGVIGFFLGVWGPGTSGLQLEAVKSSACQKFISFGCTDASSVAIRDFDADKDTTFDPGISWNPNNPNDESNQDNLASLCHFHYFRDEAACEDLCGCP